MIGRSHSVIVSLTVWLAVAWQVAAQSPQTAGTVLKGWDRNRNGLLERSEIPAAERNELDDLAKRKGLDPTKGLPIKTLLAKDDGKLRKTTKDLAENNTKDASTQEVKAKQDKQSTAESEKSKPALPASDNAKSGVMGFGGSGQSIRAKGFGTSQRQATNAAKPTADKPTQEKDQNKDSVEARKIQVFAKSMMAQHDANKNGRLEKSEWSRLRGNPRASDRNGDGVLSTEELADHLAGFAAREKEPRAPRGSKASTRSKSNLSGKPRKTYRFLTPHERLPKGLPSWFTEKDLNEDGQLSLYEYAAELSQVKLQQFLTFDLNNDGLIVPKEYLKTTE